MKLIINCIKKLKFIESKNHVIASISEAIHKNLDSKKISYVDCHEIARAISRNDTQMDSILSPTHHPIFIESNMKG